MYPSDWLRVVAPDPPYFHPMCEAQPQLYVSMPIAALVLSEEPLPGLSAMSLHENFPPKS